MLTNGYEKRNKESDDNGNWQLNKGHKRSYNNKQSNNDGKPSNVNEKSRNFNGKLKSSDEKPGNVNKKLHRNNQFDHITQKLTIGFITFSGIFLQCQGKLIEINF